MLRSKTVYLKVDRSNFLMLSYDCPFLCLSVLSESKTMAVCFSAENQIQDSRLINSVAQFTLRCNKLACLIRANLYNLIQGVYET